MGKVGSVAGKTEWLGGVEGIVLGHGRGPSVDPCTCAASGAET